MTENQRRDLQGGFGGWSLIGLALLGLIAVLTISTARSGRPIWLLDERSMWLMVLIGAGYLCSIAVLAVGESFGRRASVLQVVLIGCATTVPLLGAVLFYHPQFSRTAMLAGPVVAMCLAWLTVAVKNHLRARAAIVALLAVVGMGLQAASALQLTKRGQPQPHRQVSQINTALYTLSATSFDGYIPRPETNQGGIDRFRDGYILATGDGAIFVYRRNVENNTITAEQIPTNVPIDTKEFLAVATGSSIILNWFRVADVLALESAETFRLLVTHHYYKADEGCWVMRISALDGRYDNFNSHAKDLAWKTVFETKPCIPLATKDQPMQFQGLFDGGRMVLLNDHELLLSVGDHGMEGFGYSVATSQAPDTSYGKILLIDMRDFSSQIYALGVRNPEGLLLTPSGTVWETEHGPQGGDELNLIRRGANYGWPLVTYGVEYGTHAWPLTTTPGNHDGFEQPMFSWYPSIGPSNLIEVTSPLFPAWRGDLLVSSLAANSLFRIRVREGRIVHMEQIRIGERIRDILEGHHGEIVMWTDRESMIFLEPSNVDSSSGESLYAVCAGCHVTHAPGASSIGPSLTNIAGRRVASQGGFEYTQALRALGGSWTKERLDAFLTNPSAYAPGTSMQFAGFPDPVSRAHLVEYLISPQSRLDQTPASPETN